MKILFVSAVFPYPLRSGGQIRIYNLLKRLSCDHEITLVSFIRNDEERKYIRELNFCKEVHVVMRGRAWQPRYMARAVFGKFPFLLSTYENATMHQLLRDVLVRDTYDLVHLEPFYVWPSIPKTTVPIVVSEHNVEYKVYQQYVERSIPFLRPFLWIDVAKLVRWERIVWKYVRMVTAVSYEDAELILQGGAKSVEVVPNGVDLSQFVYRAKRQKKDGPSLLFVGDFRWFPNVDALNVLLTQVWPKVQKIYQNATLRIVGRHMSTSIITKIEQAGAEVAQDVEDISAEYRASDILVAPHGIAGGTKFKILEAMSSGCAVVTTKQGAAGLDLTAGKQYIEATTQDEFVQGIQRVWKNMTLYKTLTAQARKHVEDNFSWDAIASRLESVWKEACAHN